MAVPFAGVSTAPVSATFAQVSPVNYAAVLADYPTYLVEFDSYVGTGAGSTLHPIGVSTTAVSDTPFGSSSGAQGVTLRYSDTGWIGEPNDGMRANVVYPGRLLRAFDFERALPILPESDQQIGVSYGALEIANGDGALDPVTAGYSIAGRAVRVYRGTRTSLTDGVTYYSDFATSFQVVSAAVGTQWTHDEDRVTLNLTSDDVRLDTPIQPVVFAGTGGIEGDAQWAGKPRPILLGVKRNFQGCLIDAINSVYMLHDMPGLVVDAAWTQGVALVYTVDYTDYTTLIAASLSIGQYATCLALGLVRVNTSTAFVSFDAHTTPTFGVSAQGTHGALIFTLLSTRLHWSLADFSPSTLWSLPPGPAGNYYGDGQIFTVRDTLKGILRSCGGFMFRQRNGALAFGRLPVPETSPSVMSLTQVDLHSRLERAERPSDPRYIQRVGWQTLGTVQSGANVVDAAASRRPYLQQPYRIVSSTNPAIQFRYPHAPQTDPLPTMFDTAADAKTLADYFMLLHGVERQVFTCDVMRAGYKVDLGSVINVAYPRYGFTNGKNFVVVGVRDHGDLNTLTLWG